MSEEEPVAVRAWAWAWAWRCWVVGDGLDSVVVRIPICCCWEEGDGRSFHCWPLVEEVYLVLLGGLLEVVVVSNKGEEVVET